MTEEKDYTDENKKRMLIALAIMLGANIENKLSEYSNIPKPILAEAKRIYIERQLKSIVEKPERISERDVQIQIANKGAADKIELYEITGVKDQSTCKDCAKWQGKKVAMHKGNHNYPLVEDFINDHGFHPNCRCALLPIETSEIPLKKINPRYDTRKAANPAAYNTAIHLSELVFN